MDCRITSCAHLREVNITGQYSKHCRILHGHNSHSQYWVVPSSVCAHVCTNSIYAALPPDMPISISSSLSHTSPVLHPAPASGPPLQTLKSQGYHPFRPFCQFIFSHRLSLVTPPSLALPIGSMSLSLRPYGLCRSENMFSSLFCIAVYVT
jgi:hypothetical protein